MQHGRDAEMDFPKTRPHLAVNYYSVLNAIRLKCVHFLILFFPVEGFISRKWFLLNINITTYTSIHNLDLPVHCALFHRDILNFKWWIAHISNRSHFSAICANVICDKSFHSVHHSSLHSVDEYWTIFNIRLVFLWYRLWDLHELTENICYIWMKFIGLTCRLSAIIFSIHNMISSIFLLIAQGAYRAQCTYRWLRLHFLNSNKTHPHQFILKDFHFIHW